VEETTGRREVRTGRNKEGERGKERTQGDSREEGQRGTKGGGSREEGAGQRWRGAARGWAQCTLLPALPLSLAATHQTPPLKVSFCANKAAFSCTAPRCAAAEAVQMANNTQYGLAAYFFTQDLSRAWRVAERLEYGMVGVNEVAITSEVRLAWLKGGAQAGKRSGQGWQAGRRRLLDRCRWRRRGACSRGQSQLSPSVVG
jgi:hypothetical protein